jgi:tetratricopeptide (TPR) repeat protein
LTAKVRSPAFALVLLLCAGALAEPTQARLLDGVRAFQAGDYARALATFQEVEARPDAPPDLAFYIGPTLYKLGRYADALDVFLRARGDSDVLSGFYRAQTYYRLGLYRKARASFVELQGRGLGPRLGAAADLHVQLIDALFVTAPPAAAIDSYLAQGRQLVAAGRAALAAEYFDEARLVEALAPVPHRRDEILAALASARDLAGQANP